MKPPTTWVLLADTSFARILENSGPGEGLHQLRGFTFNADEKHTWSDDEGRVQGGMGQSKSRLDKHIEYEPEVEQFARELIDTLGKEQRHKRFDKLVISAPPSMLGLLRSLLPDELKNILKMELNKELVRTPTEDVAKHFAGVMKF